MGLLDRLKSNKNNKDFFEWLDLLLKNELSSEIKAIIFNLYEDTDNKWSIELVGTFSFNRIMTIGLNQKQYTVGD